MENENAVLIVGLGNPGASYQATRHNVGFTVVSALVRKYAFSFKHSTRLSGEVAQGSIGDKKAYVVRPDTFMNESGRSVGACVGYYKIPLEQLIIVTDDAALPLGELRMRSQGSSGGHNGLRSIEAHLNTQHYPRLRIGIGGSQYEATLRDYVLDTFYQEERPLVEEVVVRAVGALELWTATGIASAMRVVNTDKSAGDKKNDQAKETSL
ncbi:MAG TPA: aminoacyl-tRNA hydrolase [Rhabdochlamydiaceae bacterium]|jgi:PTH1 family peptidyl-tRNA hydrolase